MGNIICKTSELRLMLIGMVGDEKTSVMNILLDQKPAADAENIFLPEIEKCHKETITIGGQRVVVVNTPGLCSLETEDDVDVIKEVKKGVSVVAPGPHVILLVLPLGPFTEELQNMVKLFKTSFGESLMKFMMVLFQERAKENEKDIEEFISENEDLKKFVSDDCEKRYHVLHSNDDPSQVIELVKKIQRMVEKNNRDFYVDVQARRKRIALSINGAAVVGAGVGGAVSHFVGSPISWLGGLGLGAGVGGVVGFIGIVVAERSRKQGCVLQ